MIVLDTHAWIWWISESEKLSESARRLIDKADRENPVCISSISVWEFFMIVERGRLQIKGDPIHWVRQCEISSIIRFIPVDNEIARISAQFSKEAMSDPADRIIVATAKSLGLPLISKDRKIQSAAEVKTIW